MPVILQQILLQYSLLDLQEIDQLSWRFSIYYLLYLSTESSQHLA
nr:MAG TPA: hypothetical protein [Caudoviricetes sp.]